MSRAAHIPNTATADAPPAVLLPYQQRWVADPSPFKVGEKSRRTGLTWAEASDDVLIAAAEKSAGGQNVYYVGTDQEMTEEYIQACAMWAKAYNRAASGIGEGWWDDDRGQYRDGAARNPDRDIKSYSIRFPNSKHRIVALASRPRKLRGRQGVLVGDEAAFQDELGELIKAAMAFVIWGGKVRIISTHDGENNPFNELLNEVRSGKRPGSIHRIPFRQAVAEGLYRRVCLRMGKSWTAEEESTWMQGVYDLYSEGAAEELDCIPSQGNGAFLTGVLIEARMVDAPVLRLEYRNEFAAEAQWARTAACQTWIDEHLAPLLDALPKCARWDFGMDFGRTGDISVIAPIGTAAHLRRTVPFLVEMRNVPFDQQEQVLFYIADRLNFGRGLIDARGNGSQLAEHAWQKYGGSRIERVMLTESWYREHMPAFKTAFEDGALETLPRSLDVKNDLLTLRMQRGVAKLPETGATRKGTDGKPRHGDSAIALVLAWTATRQDAVSVDYIPVPKRPTATAGDPDDDDLHDPDRRSDW